MTSASAGGQRSASIAISSVVSRFQASTASIRSWTLRELVGGLVGVVHRQLVEAVEQRAGLGDAVLDVAPDVLGRVELGLLLEQSDGRVRGELGLAVELGVEAGHDPQQRRLAGAVVAEHADLRAGQERQRDVGQDLAVGRVAARELVGREDVLGGHAHSQHRTRGTMGRMRALAAVFALIAVACMSLAIVGMVTGRPGLPGGLADPRAGARCASPRCCWARWRIELVAAAERQ